MYTFYNRGMASTIVCFYTLRSKGEVPIIVVIGCRRRVQCHSGNNGRTILQRFGSKLSYEKCSESRGICGVNQYRRKANLGGMGA